MMPMAMRWRQMRGKQGSIGRHYRHIHSDRGTRQMLQDAVRQRDYDHYVCGLLLPQNKRAAYFAIRAWNVEIAGIKDAAHGHLAASTIRMQWWRERLAQIYRRPASASMGATQQNSALLEMLDQAIQQHRLTRGWFERVLDAREDDLEIDQPASLDDAVEYATRTAGSLLSLTLEVLGTRDDEADRAASHAGIAIGLATMLRATSSHAARQLVYLPQDLVDKHKIAVEGGQMRASIERKELGRLLSPAVRDVAFAALEHLQSAGSIIRTLPRAIQPAFLPIVPTAMLLTDLEKTAFDICAANLCQVQPFRLHARVLLHYFLVRFGIALAPHATVSMR